MSPYVENKIQREWRKVHESGGAPEKPGGRALNVNSNL